MTGLLLAAAAASGVYLLYTALVFGRRGLRGPAVTPGVRATAVDRLRGRGQARVEAWMTQAGMHQVGLAELAAVAAVVGTLCGLGGLVVFGAVGPAFTVAVTVAVGWPLAAYRLRVERRRAAAQEAWPRLLEEIRLLTANVGYSVPQALFEAGRRAPVELRPAFEAAHREWLLSTDFERTVAVLKTRLADPAADAACETLLVAHQVGGGDLARRIEALIEDRVLDVQCRKDARARQAAVRFSRRFVLLVPCGMAVVGMTIGTGRDAYRTPWGQTMVAVGVAMVVVCWIWAGRLLRLPVDERVFP